MKKVLLLAASLVLAAACSGPAATTTVRPTSTATVAATPTPTAAASPTMAATSPAASVSPAASGSPTGETVTLAQTSLGMVLVGSNGKTLYGFTPDVDAGEPTCYEDCAALWPPLTVTGDFTVGEGLDETMFAAVARTDGSQQLAIGDYPLYFYTPDINPGDVNGQGLGDVWYVVGADGQLITTAP